MKRLPNHYDVANEDKSTEVLDLSVIADNEFSDFISGKSGHISNEVRGKIKQALMDGGIKIDMFLTAYAQKGASRLAKVMEFLDHVDKELFQKWRIKTMDNGQLINLLGELDGEKHRSVKEFIDISNKFQEQDLNSKLNSVLSKTKAIDLPKESRDRLVKFFKERISDAKTDS